jgi:hypothetical protein
MCIFCGGTCGGVGDALMPFLGVGMSMAVIKLRAKMASRRAESQAEPEEPAETAEGDTRSAS